MKTAGFTLIELMVVISVIGMLSSVLISNVSASRTKANNTYSIQSVKEYINALYLYRESNSTVLTTHDGVGAQYCCLSGSDCYSSSSGIEVCPAVNNGLRPYIPSMPKTNNKELYPYGGPWGVSSAYYQCNHLDPTDCAISLFLEGDVSCPYNGYKMFFSGSGVTNCLIYPYR